MNDPKDAVNEVASMLYEKGITCDFGINESILPSMIDLARTRYSDKKIRAVKNWIWWDLDISDEARGQFEANGLKPAMVFAHYLIWDSSKQFSEGWNVKTTTLVAFEENCFFITRNTVYILVGQGYRKMVDPKTADSLYF